MAENSPKSRHLRYQEVIVRILEYIRKNEIPPEGRLPSEREWMSQWKVSQPTVNKAVACLMAEGRLRREGYRLFVANQDEIRPQTPPIHVLCPHVEYQRTVLVQHDLVEAAHDTAAIFHGQITPRLAKTPAEQRLHVAQLLREKVAGFLIWPISNASLEDLFVQCQASGIPFVICDADIGRFDYVGIDNEIGVRLALAHLIALGHRQIAYLTDRPRLSPSLQRRGRGLPARLLFPRRKNLDETNHRSSHHLPLGGRAGDGSSAQSLSRGDRCFL
jgi:GntR family transcriptional regulator of arabinose operon